VNPKIQTETVAVFKGPTCHRMGETYDDYRVFRMVLIPAHCTSACEDVTVKIDHHLHPDTSHGLGWGRKSYM